MQNPQCSDPKTLLQQPIHQDPNAQHSTLNSKPQTPNPKSQTSNPKPQTPNPKPQTLNPDQVERRISSTESIAKMSSTKSMPSTRSQEGSRSQEDSGDEFAPEVRIFPVVPHTNLCQILPVVPEMRHTPSRYGVSRRLVSWCASPPLASGLCHTVDSKDESALEARAWSDFACRP